MHHEPDLGGFPEMRPCLVYLELPDLLKDYIRCFFGNDLLSDKVKVLLLAGNDLHPTAEFNGWQGEDFKFFRFLYEDGILGEKENIDIKVLWKLSKATDANKPAGFDFQIRPTTFVAPHKRWYVSPPIKL